ncbi:hypothetical protein RHGRI_030000 [Rhododendron griersonianum]|uniref:Uncharacterized protein n=1 Tax=Rhododendron griersonianum TaxID=479676 RepID=A0AAV6ILD7_9ERIC|nr:hypothetical protein RHGRI_030000 [Rhododendron griersonianum]
MLRDWITSTSKENRFVIIIKSSERMANNRRSRMRFACERGEKYRRYEGNYLEDDQKHQPV